MAAEGWGGCVVSFTSRGRGRFLFSEVRSVGRLDGTPEEGGFAKGHASSAISVDAGLFLERRKRWKNGSLFFGLLLLV